MKISNESSFFLSSLVIFFISRVVVVVVVVVLLVFVLVLVLVLLLFLLHLFLFHLLLLLPLSSFSFLFFSFCFVNFFFLFFFLLPCNHRCIRPMGDYSNNTAHKAKLSDTIPGALLLDSVTILAHPRIDALGQRVHKKMIM